MKKVILILFLLLAPICVTTPTAANTPPQIIQYLFAITPNPNDSLAKTMGQTYIDIQKKMDQMSEKIQKQFEKYTAMADKLQAKLEGLAGKLLDSLGLGSDLNKTQVDDEAQGADKQDSVIKRVKTNMEGKYTDELKGGAEAEKEQVKKRAAERQKNNIDKLARLLVLKGRLPKVVDELSQVQAELQQSLDAVNSSDKNKASVEEALRIHAKLKIAWYNLMALQMQIETYNLDAVASQGLASMPTVKMDMEYKDEYQIKAPKKAK